MRGVTATRLVFRTGLALALLTAAVLTYLLIRAVDHRSLSDQNIGYLLLFNGFLVTALLCAIVAMAWRLRQRLKEGRFGSKLLMKLAAIFALVGVLPGLLIYSVSYQFVSRSIESWFDVRVESALDAGLNLGRLTLDNLSNDLSNKVRSVVPTLQMESDAGLAVKLDRLREQWGADDAQVWTHTGTLLASSGESRFQLAPERPTAQQMRNLKTQRSLSVFEGLDDTNKTKGARLKVLVSIGTPSLELMAEPRYLVVSERLPASIVENALIVQTAYSEYQERALARSGLQKMYIGTLTLSLFLAVLGAFILAVILGNQLVRPLLVLALGVERVSAGDLSPKLVLSDDNELAGLTRSFASMTQQLADARIAEQKTERVKAWNEVAQRVAHEIKNPLTPIQLSAERLAMKLAGKLEGADLAVLEKSVKTIVDQVEAMKRLVNEFRDYARLPSARLQSLSLLQVVQDTLSLYENEVQQGTIQVVAAPDLPNMEGDAEQLRQVIHNLLQNALDAAQASSAVSGLDKQIILTLRQDANQTALICRIEDNGTGFASHILARAFEPYNTTKPKGTGLGLAVVRKIVQEHHGEITLSNKSEVEGLGARVELSFPLTKKDVGV
ncbi:MAG: ATP-binding protein [Cytophagales bacterium]|nr:ATP-binding protein [Cytophagales bacterium]